MERGRADDVDLRVEPQTAVVQRKRIDHVEDVPERVAILLDVELDRTSGGRERLDGWLRQPSALLAIPRALVEPVVSKDEVTDRVPSEIELGPIDPRAEESPKVLRVVHAVPDELDMI